MDMHNQYHEEILNATNPAREIRKDNIAGMVEKAHLYITDLILKKALAIRSLENLINSPNERDKISSDHEFDDDAQEKIGKKESFVEILRDEQAEQRLLQKVLINQLIRVENKRKLLKKFPELV